MTVSERKPIPWLEPWIEGISPGWAMDLGAGSGDTARWLASRGFDVEAVEHDLNAVSQLHELAEADPRIHVMEADVGDLLIEPDRYRLILALAVLHFLRPRDLWPLADHLQRGLKSGGLMVAEVFTVDDPGCAWYRQVGRREVEPNTFRMEGGRGWIHYFEPGELSRTFGSLETLVYEEFRSADPGADPRYRAGARLIAKRTSEW